MHTSSIPVNFISLLGHIFSGHLQERCFGENFIWRICWTGFRLSDYFLLLSCIRVASHSWRSNTSNFSITEVWLEKRMCKNQFSSVQSLSHLRLFATPWIAACQSFLSLTNSRSLLRLMSIKPGDITQPSHPLSSPSPPAFNLSQHPGLFQCVFFTCSSHQVAKVLDFQLQHQSFQWIFRTDFLYNGLLWPPCSPRDSQESSPTPQFKSNNSLVFGFLYRPTLTSIHDHRKNHSLD